MSLPRPLCNLLGTSCLLASACAAQAPSTELESAVAELSAGACQAQPLEPGVFSTAADEGRIVFSLDGDHAYFHRATPAGLRIFESHRVAGAWSPPVASSFASGYDEIDPFLTLDGRELYYSSFRPAPGATEPRGDADIWKVRRVGAGWSAPSFVADVNTEHMELFPSLTLDGTIYFNSQRPGGAGAWDIYAARRRGAGFAAPAPLPGGVNTAIWEYNPSPSPGGALLAFASLDPDPAAPYSDAFFALRVGGGYTERVDAGPCINTLDEEYHPTLDLPRNRLVFVRRDPLDPAGHGDFYEVPLTAALRQLLQR
jgi:hypothetical protein